MTLSLLLLTTAVIIAIGAHIPVHGRSIRDRLRHTEHGTLIGLRLTPGLRSHISSADIVALADDSPVPLDALCFYHVMPDIRGEYAHRYFRAAERYGATPGAWTHLVVTLPDEASETQALDFLLHRLGLLGIRARPLTEHECALTISTQELVQLRRTGHSDHVAALGRKPHLWLSRHRDIAITSGPAQVIGVGSSGQTVTMCPANLPRLEVQCDAQNACELLIGMLCLGYRVGIRTSQPRLFSVALELGAVLLTRAGDTTVDVIVFEDYEPDLYTGIARIIHVNRADTGRKADSPTALSTSCPCLIMGEFTWTLSTARNSVELQPLALRPATGSMPATGSIPESIGRARAGHPAPGRHQARPEQQAHLARQFPGYQAGHPPREERPPSASLHR